MVLGYTFKNKRLIAVETLEERIKTATEFIKGFTTIGLGMTMTNWNGK